MTPLVYALLAAAGNVLGGVVVTRGAKWGLRFIELCLAFGAGFMLAVVFLEMLPEAYRSGGSDAFAYAFVGYLLVHLTQHTAVHHLHFGEETHHVTEAAGVSALVGLLLHTFFDGVAIASGFAVSQQLGFLLFLAILLHKLPEGVTISSLLLAGGRRPRQAVGAAALLGIATVAGVVAQDSVQFLVGHGLALSAGVTTYVGASNLVPEFQGKKGWSLPAAFFAGAAGFYALRALL